MIAMCDSLQFERIEHDRLPRSHVSDHQSHAGGPNFLEDLDGCEFVVDGGNFRTNVHDSDHEREVLVVLVVVDERQLLGDNQESLIGLAQAVFARSRIVVFA